MAESPGVYSVPGPSHPGYKAVFGVNRGARIRDITDGTSSTLIMVEYLTGVPNAPHPFDLRGWFWTSQAGYGLIFAWSSPNSSSPDILCGHCAPETNQPSMNLPCEHGGSSLSEAFRRTATSRSRHPGGVNVVLCDGSVHFINEVIDVFTWQAMGTINSGAERNARGQSSRSRSVWVDREGKFPDCRSGRSPRKDGRLHQCTTWAVRRESSSTP